MQQRNRILLTTPMDVCFQIAKGFYETKITHLLETSESAVVYVRNSWGYPGLKIVFAHKENGRAYDEAESRQVVIVDGFSEVGSRYALKLFLASDEMARRDYKKEIDALKKLALFPARPASDQVTRAFSHHSSTYPLRVFHAGQVEINSKKYFAIAMEAFISDMNSGDARSMILSNQNCCKVFLYQLLIQLKIIFAKKCCHVDIKPDNICTTSHSSSEANFVLIDFGHLREADKIFSNMGNPHPAGTHGYRSLDLLSGTVSYRGDVESLVITVLTIMGCSLGQEFDEELSGAVTRGKFLAKLKDTLDVKIVQKKPFDPITASSLASSYLAAYKLTHDHPGYFAYSFLHKLLAAVFMADGLRPFDLDPLIDMVGPESEPLNTIFQKSRLASKTSFFSKTKSSDGKSADQLFDLFSQPARIEASKHAKRQINAAISSGSSKRVVNADPTCPGRTIYSDGATLENHPLWRLYERLKKYEYGPDQRADLLEALTYFNDCMKLHSNVFQMEQITFANVWTLSMFFDNMEEEGIRFHQLEEYSFKRGVPSNKMVSALCITKQVAQGIAGLIKSGDTQAFVRTERFDDVNVTQLRCHPLALFKLYLVALHHHSHALRSSGKLEVFVVNDEFGEPFQLSLPDMEYILFFYLLVLYCQLIQKGLDFSETRLTKSSSQGSIWRKLSNMPVFGPLNDITTDNPSLNMFPFYGREISRSRDLIEYALGSFEISPTLVSHLLQLLQAQNDSCANVLIIPPTAFGIICPNDVWDDRVKLLQSIQIVNSLFGTNQQRDELNRNDSRLIIAVMQDTIQVTSDITKDSFSLFTLQYNHNERNVDDPLFLFMSAHPKRTMPPALKKLLQLCSMAGHWFGRVAKSAFDSSSGTYTIKPSHEISANHLTDGDDGMTQIFLTVAQILNFHKLDSQTPFHCRTVQLSSGRNGRKEVIDILYNNELQPECFPPVLKKFEQTFAQLKAKIPPLTNRFASALDFFSQENVRRCEKILNFRSKSNNTWFKSITPDDGAEFDIHNYALGSFQGSDVANMACRRFNQNMSMLPEQPCVFCLDVNTQSKLLSMKLSDEMELKDTFSRHMQRKDPNASQIVKAADFICSPMFDGRSHWVLVVFDMKERRYILIDSMAKHKPTHTLLAKMQKLFQCLKVCSIIDAQWPDQVDIFQSCVVPQFNNCCLFLAITVMEAICSLSVRVQEAPQRILSIQGLITTRFKLPSDLSYDSVESALRLYFLMCDAEPHRFCIFSETSALNLYTGFSVALQMAPSVGYSLLNFTKHSVVSDIYNDDSLWNIILKADGVRSNRDCEHDVAIYIESGREQRPLNLHPAFVTSTVQKQTRLAPGLSMPSVAVGADDFLFDESVVSSTTTSKVVERAVMSSARARLNFAAPQILSFQHDIMQNQPVGPHENQYENEFDSAEPPESMPAYLQWIPSNSDQLKYLMDIDAVSIVARSVEILFSSINKTALVEMFERPRITQVKRSLRLGITFGTNVDTCSKTSIGQVTSLGNCPMELSVLRKISKGERAARFDDIQFVLDSFWSDKRTSDVYRNRPKSSKVALHQIKQPLCDSFATKLEDEALFCVLLIGSKNDIQNETAVGFYDIETAMQNTIKVLAQAGINDDYLCQASPDDLNYSYDFGISVRHIDEAQSIHMSRHICVQLQEMSGSRSDTVKDTLGHKAFIGGYHCTDIRSKSHLFQGVAGLKIYGTAQNEDIARRVPVSFFVMPDQVAQAVMIPSSGGQSRALSSVKTFFEDGQELVRKAGSITRGWLRIEISTKSVQKACDLASSILEDEKSLVVSPVAYIWKELYANLLDKTVLILHKLAQGLLHSKEMETAPAREPNGDDDELDPASSYPLHLRSLAAADPEYADLLCQDVDGNDWRHVCYFKVVARFLIEGLTESLQRTGNNISVVLRSFAADEEKRYFLQLPTLSYVLKSMQTFYKDGEPRHELLFPEKMLSQALLWESYGKVADVDIGLSHKKYAFHVRHVYECRTLLCEASPQNFEVVETEVWQKTARYIVSCVWWNILAAEGVRLEPDDMEALNSKSLSLTKSKLEKYLTGPRKHPLVVLECNSCNWLQYIENLCSQKNTDEGMHCNSVAYIFSLMRGQSKLRVVSLLYDAFMNSHIADVVPMTSNDPNKIFERQNHFTSLGLISGNYLEAKIAQQLSGSPRKIELPSPKPTSAKDYFNRLIEKIQADHAQDKDMSVKIDRVLASITEPTRTRGSRARNTIEFKVKFYTNVVRAFPGILYQSALWPESACTWFLLTDYIETLNDNAGDDSLSEVKRNHRTSKRLWDLVNKTDQFQKLKQEVEQHKSSSDKGSIVTPTKKDQSSRLDITSIQAQGGSQREKDLQHRVSAKMEAHGQAPSGKSENAGFGDEGLLVLEDPSSPDHPKVSSQTVLKTAVGATSEKGVIEQKNYQSRPDQVQKEMPNITLSTNLYKRKRSRDSTGGISELDNVDITPGELDTTLAAEDPFLPKPQSLEGDPEKLENCTSWVKGSPKFDNFRKTVGSTLLDDCTMSNPKKSESVAKNALAISTNDPSLSGKRAPTNIKQASDAGESARKHGSDDSSSPGFISAKQAKVDNASIVSPVTTEDGASIALLNKTMLAEFDHKMDDMRKDMNKMMLAMENKMMMAIERLAASQGSRRNLPHPLSRSQVSSSTTDVSLPLAPVNLSGQHKTAVKQFEPTSSPLSTAQSPVSQSIKVPSPPQSVSSFTSSQLEKLTGYTHTDFYFDAIASGFYPPPGKIPKANIPATKHVPSHNMDTRSSSSKSLLASGSKSVHGSARKSSELTEEEVAEILRELDKKVSKREVIDKDDKNEVEEEPKKRKSDTPVKTTKADVKRRKDA